jgi:NhaP-type Na+/H+ or K+/H+ antiporter
MIAVVVMSAVATLLCALASWMKSHMDTIGFKRVGFSRYPANLRYWLLRLETDEARKRLDGWHVCQSVWYAAQSLAFFLFGLVVANVAATYALSWWMMVVLLAVAWVLRLAAHWIGFTKTYPIG